MRRLAALYTLGSLLIALVYGPEFHMHDSDEHGDGPLVHVHMDVHIPESEEFHHDTGPGIESHSHAARYIDLLASTITSTAIHLFVAPAVSLLQPKGELRCSCLVFEEPRIHDPPALDRSAPRSPPPTT